MSLNAQRAAARAASWFLHAPGAVLRGVPDRFLTGESRPYKFREGIWDSVRPDSQVGKGGWGAWELDGRYSTADLTDEANVGGDEQNIALGLNWYPIANVRFMANWIHVLDLEGGTSDGAEPSAFVLRSAVFW